MQWNGTEQATNIIQPKMDQFIDPYMRHLASMS